jgi:hypothetical protein
LVKGANPETEMVGVRSDDVQTDDPAPDAGDLETVENVEPDVDETPALPDYIVENLDQDHVREILRSQFGR